MNSIKIPLIDTRVNNSKEKKCNTLNNTFLTEERNVAEVFNCESEFSVGVLIEFCLSVILVSIFGS